MFNSCPLSFHTSQVMNIAISPTILPRAARSQNKVSCRANSPQNLVRAHKMLRSRAQMALEILDSFQNQIYKRYQKSKICPWKLFEGPHIFAGVQIATWIFWLILTLGAANGGHLCFTKSPNFPFLSLVLCIFSNHSLLILVEYFSHFLLSMFWTSRDATLFLYKF